MSHKVKLFEEGERFTIENGVSYTKEVSEMLKIDGISIGRKRRKDGRFQGYAIGENGEKVYFYGYSPREIALKIKEFLLKGGKPEPKKEKTPTVKEWLEQWYNLYKVPNLKPKSLQSIRTSLNHIEKEFEETRLNKLNTDDLQVFFLSFKAERVRDMAIAVLRSALEKARKKGIIKVNPCEALEIKPHRKERRKGLTIKEQEETSRVVKNSALEPIFNVLLATGIRVGELLALTEKDVDFENLTISINKDVVFIGGKRIVQDTKTEAGKRTVPIPKSIVKYLKGSGTLFPITYNAVRCGFRRLSAKTGINVSAHTLRHTYSDRLEEIAIPPKVKQYLLGHANLDVTQNIYTDIKFEFVKEFSSKINSAFDT